eukprot:m.145100 g.145100  ORF g.145100 m.145100 type:complete len:91 (+) comp17213_c1_seq3:107-379(+)
MWSRWVCFFFVWSFMSFPSLFVLFLWKPNTPSLLSVMAAVGFFHLCYHVVPVALCAVSVGKPRRLVPSDLPLGLAFGLFLAHLELEHELL